MAIFDWVFNIEIWAALLTLSVLEIVLGIDNIIFISIMASKLPRHQRAKARQVGLSLALITRIMLLSTIAWIAGLREPFLIIYDFDLSWRDIVLFGGGLFLVYKGTNEIYAMIEIDEEAERKIKGISFLSVVVQIMFIDIVFSLDSVITAVGMSNHLPVMITAVVVAVIAMLFASGPLSDFVEKHPSVKMLALAFLLLVGVLLIADGLHFHFPREYLYFAMAFSVLVEGLNLFHRKRKNSRKKDVT
ncbi:MAG: TerC family protein [Alphaproteobacteria bacterium]